MDTHSVLETKREQANSLVNEIIAKRDSIDNILTEANTLLGKINKHDKNYNALNNNLKNINATTQAAIITFKKDKAILAKELDSINSFYENKYIPLLNKINDKQTGFSAKIKQGDKELKEYHKIKEECQKQYSNILILAKNFKAKTAELSKIETTVNSLHKSAESNKGKIDIIFEKIKNVQIEITESHKIIKKLETDSNLSTTKITAFEKSSHDLNEKIITMHNTSEEKLAAIQKIYEISHETGLSGEFENRRNSLFKEMKRWEQFVLGTSLILIIGIIILFCFQLKLNNYQLNNTFDLNFYIRFLIFSPIVYYLYFVSTQYNKAKKLYDKYAFKTTLSMTIKSHIELLTQHGYFNGNGQSDKILDFIIQGFQKIYNEPYNINSCKNKNDLSEFEINIQKKIIDKLTGILEDSSNKIVKTATEVLKDK